MSDEEETYENGEEEDTAAEEAPEAEATDAEEEAPNYRNHNNHRRYEYDDYSSGDEYEAELVHSWSKPPPPRAEEVETKELTEAEMALLAQKKKHEADEAEKMKDYEEQRRIQREKDEEELRLLKEKQERRRQEREEEERLMQEKRKEEEDRRKKEDEQRKTKAEEDRKRKIEEKTKRAAMMPGLQTGGTGVGPNFEVQKAEPGADKFDKFGNIMKAKEEMGQTRQQHDEQKKKLLQEFQKPLNTEGMDVSALKSKIKELHQRICKLESLKYDMEQRQVRQDYDLKELTERQRQISRNKALKKGLDPEEAAQSNHPPKVPVASKYDRQTDRRSYGDKRELFENPKKPKDPKLFHGSARPPTQWGTRTNEELENLKKNLGPPKYVETVKAENAKPPMEPIPVQMPAEEDGGDDS